MDIDQLALTMAEFRGEVKAFREIFGQHTTQDMEQFTALAATIEKMDDKLDRLLIREAERKGEMLGFKRSAILVATSASIVISGVGIAVHAFVG